MMNPKILAVLVALALVAGAAWYIASGSGSAGTNDVLAGVAGEVMVSTPSGSRSVPPGRVPPEFMLARDGQTLLLEDLKGKFVFINFWNTWCPPCREEMPDLNRLYQDYRDKNVEFLFINITSQEKSQQQVVEFIQDMDLQLPVYLDRKGEVAGVYGIRSIPTTVVLNPEGNVIYARAGTLTYQQGETLIQ